MIPKGADIMQDMTERVYRLLAELLADQREMDIKKTLFVEDEEKK